MSKIQSCCRYLRKLHHGPNQTLLIHRCCVAVRLLDQPRVEPLRATKVVFPASRCQARSFASSQARHKKGGKTAPASSGDGPGSADPSDFSALRKGIDHAHEKLREDLSKLRGGGKLNPEVLEGMRVKIDKGASTERLSDIAQVIARGRTMQIIASEKEHVKAITSTILSSDLNLTPQPDSENPQQLNITLPPPTTEARKQAVQAAQKAADVANDAVRNARGVHQKALRAMEKARSARPDDIKKAGSEMEKVVANGTAEVKKIADAAKKVLEGG